MGAPGGGVSLSYAVLTGEDIAPALDAVARLRISVFRAFPYLYDGTLDYERGYLATFARAEGAIIVAARDGAEIVGAATGCKLASEHEPFQRPFLQVGMDVARIFYCAESVLLPDYRGQGAGHRFFALRESHARGLGCTAAAFCAVMRPPDHPARPVDYRPLDSFWMRRGYQPVPRLMTNYSWRDLGESHDTDKPMQFWMRTL
jgi:GNAT superfamily N-acetyltransferase